MTEYNNLNDYLKNMIKEVTCYRQEILTIFHTNKHT